MKGLKSPVFSGLITDIYLVHMEECLVLRHQGIPWLSQYPHQHVLCQVVEWYDYWEATNKLRDHPKVYQVTSLSLDGRKLGGYLNVL